MNGPNPLAIPATIRDAMVAHCLREAPLEACGLLGGSGRAIASFFPLRNELQSEARYQADPNELIAAVQAIRGRGEEILAIYHSHPHTHPIPSKTDIRENYYGEVPRIIVSLAGAEPEVRIWRLDPESFEELPWRVVDGTAAAPGS
jgi:proteasome lid subunit RPN8/RPN11